MLELLIAILIALGCNVQPGSTEAELRLAHGTNVDRATEIINTGSYRTGDGGGIVIVETGGD